MTMEERQKLYEAKNAALAQSDAEPQDVLTTVRKRIELVINEIMDTELIAMLRTAMRELDLALAQSDAEPKNVLDMLEKAIIASTLPEHKATDAEFMRGSIRLANEFAKDALAALARSDAKQELGDIAAAIGSTRFMDAPDGGDVSLAEQVGRMREALEKAEARRYSLSDAGPSIGEDAVNEAFNKFMEGQEYKQSGNRRLLFHAGVEFGLRHANRALAQSDAEPVTWPDIDAAVKAGLATRNPAPNAAPSGYSNAKTVTIGAAAPRPDTSAGLIEAELILKLIEEEPEFPGMQEEIKREIEAGLDWDTLKKYPLAEVVGQAIVLGCVETKQAIATKIREVIRARAADRSGK